jgi:hypothetical protein
MVFRFRRLRACRGVEDRPVVVWQMRGNVLHRRSVGTSDIMAGTKVLLRTRSLHKDMEVTCCI